MNWVVRAHAGCRDRYVYHVQARWTQLGSIADVSLDRGPGTEPVDKRSDFRREMCAFSKPINGAFRWDGTTDEPGVYLSWSDLGQLREELIAVTLLTHGRGLLQRPVRLADLRRDLA